MRKQAYRALALTAGLDVSLDPIMIANQASPELECCRFDQGLLKKDFGRASFGSVGWGNSGWGVTPWGQGEALDGYTLHIDVFTNYLGNVYYLFFTPTSVFSLSSGGQLVKLNSSPFTGNKTNNFSSTEGLDGAGKLWFIFANGKDYIQKWDGTNLKNLGGLIGCVQTISIDSGTTTGSPYKVNDVLTLVQGSAVGCTITVNAVDGSGNITQATLTTYGYGYTVASGVGVTGGNGAGATFNILDLYPTVTAQFVLPFMSMMILAYTTEAGSVCPTRLRWSVVGDSENYLGPGSGFLDAIDTTDHITGVCLFKNRFIVFKQRSIWELVYVGGTQVFTLVLLDSSVGMPGGDTIVVIGGNQIIFFGTDHIYSYDTFTLTPISSQIDHMLYPTDTGIVNYSAISQARATYVEALSEYWLVLPSQGIVPNLLFKYSFLTQSWVKRTQTITAFGQYSTPIGTSLEWINTTGTWLQQVGPWVSTPVTTGAPTILMGDDQGNLWVDNRLTTSMDQLVFQTLDWLLPTSRSQFYASPAYAAAMRVLEIHFSAQGGPFYANYSLDSGQTWSVPFLFPYASDWTEFVLYLNVITQRIRVQITSVAPTLEVEWIEPWVISKVRPVSLVA